MAINDAFQRRWKSISVTESAEPEPESAAPAESTGTFIGSGALFEGTLELRGDFRIDSEFRGALETDGNIVVGPMGSIVGDIRAREVEVYGAVVGDITARRELILHPASRVHGALESACLEIRRHAFFQGTTKMTEPQASSRSAITGSDDVRAPATP